MSARKPQTNLFPYLAKCRDLVVDFKVAQKFNIETAALLEIVRAGLGPIPIPAEASGRFWFAKGTEPSWKHWARKASDEDVNRAAEIIRTHDRALRIPEFTSCEKDDARSFLITVFEGRRR